MFRVDHDARLGLTMLYSNKRWSMRAEVNYALPDVARRK
jgi:hypothetical protein